MLTIFLIAGNLLLVNCVAVSDVQFDTVDFAQSTVHSGNSEQEQNVYSEQVYQGQVNTGQVNPGQIYLGQQNIPGYQGQFYQPGFPQYYLPNPYFPYVPYYYPYYVYYLQGVGQALPQGATLKKECSKSDPSCSKIKIHYTYNKS